MGGRTVLSSTDDGDGVWTGRVYLDSSAGPDRAPGSNIQPGHRLPDCRNAGPARSGISVDRLLALHAPRLGRRRREGGTVGRTGENRVRAALARQQPTLRSDVAVAVAKARGSAVS